MPGPLPSPCWIWQGPIHGHGYGQVTRRGKTAYAHRLFYEHHREPIANGLEIDHLCRVRACVNPAHLEVVTTSLNAIRRDRALGARERLPSGRFAPGR